MRFVRLDKPQELSVPLSDLPGAVHTDIVAVVRPDLCHDTSLGPLFGIVPVLVLDKDVISDLERMKKFSVMDVVREGKEGDRTFSSHVSHNGSKVRS